MLVTGSASTHYDRVTGAWTLLLGEELHYGLFATDADDLRSATRSLTQAMIGAAQVRSGDRVLDVGCGVGVPACYMAKNLGARVVGISTSEEGLKHARANAIREGVADLVTFELRDGMQNGFPDAAFDRVVVLESSHLMRQRDRLIAECARVLVPGGRMALCDIVLKRPMPFSEVRRLRGSFALLREVFGDARMGPVAEYRRLADDHGLRVDRESDLTAETRPTFDRWRENADLHRAEVEALLGVVRLGEFVESCDVMRGFWDDGTLGYALLGAVKVKA